MRQATWQRRLLAMGLCVVVATAIVAGGSAAGTVRSGGEAGGEVITYVGRVESLDASLAVVTDGEHAFGYLCDSAGLSEWFRGDASTKSLNLSSPSGAQLPLGLSGKRADGLVLLADGTVEDVVLREASGEAGLFREERVIDDVGYAAGWVVLPNGDVEGDVSLANITGARRALPSPLPSTEVTTTEVVGTVAPDEIVNQFPPEPPPAAEVTVVPFSTTAETEQTPGGGGTESTTSPGGATTTTTSPETERGQTEKNKKSCRENIAFLKGQIRGLQDALGETRGRRRRAAIEEQIQGLKDDLAEMQSGKFEC